MRFLPRIVFGPLLLGVLCIGPVARAAVVSVSPSAVNANLALGQPSTITVTWTVQRQTDGGGNCGTTVTSGSGTLRTGRGGPVLRVIPTVLSQTLPCARGATTPFVFTEVVTIPADVAQRAQRLGFGNIFYERTFSDPPQAASSGAAVLSIVGTATAAFEITRLALAFDNGVAARVLSLREPLAAVAEVSFNGNGLLQAQWETAGPESTAGTPIFRPLGQVREYLTAGRTQRVRSPGLPTNNVGLYLVRLRITDPATNFEAPVVRYFVTQRADQTVNAPPLALGAPPPRALLVPETVFAWEAIRDARAYQLEIYDAAVQPLGVLPELSNAAADARELDPMLSRPAVTGMFVPGSQTRTTLSALARQHLLPGQRYAWRILALGPDGTVIGVSPARELRIP